MATFTKVNDFVEDLGNEVHNLTSDTLMLAYSNTAPASESSNPLSDGNGVLANVTQISYTNLSGDRTLGSKTWSLSSGLATLDAADETITASGGSVGPFRYIYLYNDTATGDALIGVYDFGSALTLQDGDSFTLRWDASGLIALS